VFVAEACEHAKRRAPSISADAFTLLRNYSWPGNVRELRNTMERAIVLCDEVITPEHLPVEKMGETVPVQRARAVPPAAPSSAATQPIAVMGDGLTDEERTERDRIVDALARAGGNQSRACQILGISRGTLIVRLDRYGITRPRKGRNA
jgi:DNA-binding NtrC family response regulator